MPETYEDRLLADGEVIAECRVVRFLGRGGMGEVYLVEKPRIERKFALKVLPPCRDDPDDVKRFVKEAKLGSKIDHPNVVDVYDVGNRDDLYYILMQYVEGKDLAELVEEEYRGPLPWLTALKVVHDAACGLAAIHNAGLIHRDIKPSNIMRAKSGRVLVMDLGLARDVARSDLTQPGVLLGTPAFMSPEQCQGKPLDRRSDIFALGGTLYFLLTGHLPFGQGEIAAVMYKIATGEKPPPVHEVNRHVPEAVHALIARAMASDPADRFPDAKAMAREIARVSRETPSPKQAPRPETGPVSGSLVETWRQTELVPLELIPDAGPLAWVRRRLPWLVAGGMAVVGVLGLVAASAWQPAHPPAPTTAKPAEPKVRPGMVWIPPGDVQLGNSEATLRRHAKATMGTFPAQEIDDFVDHVLKGPRGRVSVAGFWIDQYEVTCGDYARFIRATGHPAPARWTGATPPTDSLDEPVTNVRHADARAYAAWAGKKLPTEAQWVRAARGDTESLFPWGDDWATERTNAHENRAFSPTRPSRVSETPLDRSDFGVFNLAGNVREMMRDLARQPGGDMVVTHGASWKATGRCYGVVSYAVFFGPAAAFDDETVGFRCVVEEP